MNTFYILVLVLFLLLLIVAGKQGIKAFFGFIINLIAIFLLIIFLNWHFNIYLSVTVISFIILAVSIYSSSDNPQVTNNAFLSSVFTYIIMFLVALPLNIFSNAQGFEVESSEELEGLFLTVGISFQNIAFAVTVIASLGAIAESSMAISADLHELIKSSPTILRKNYYKQATIIGTQIIGTAVNTLLFSVLGDNLPLAIFYTRLHYSFFRLINDKLVVSALLNLLIAIFGVVFTIPITTLIISKKHNFKL